MVYYQKNQRLNMCFSDFLGTSPGVTQVTTTTTTTTINAVCSSNLCNNRGVCQQMRYGTGVQCYCRRGWSGSRCQYGKLKHSKFLSDRSLFLLALRVNNGRSQDLIQKNETITTSTTTTIRKQRA
jgi:hypothetical protein